MNGFLKNILIVMAAVVMSVLFVTAQASAFVGLASAPAAALSAAGFSVSTVGIGVVVLAGGYLVYHVSKTSWKYFKVNSYDNVPQHVYSHLNDFPNIWKSTPSKTTFAKRCKDTINGRSSTKYYQVSDNRLIAYDAVNEMMVVGENDGRTIVTCTRFKMSDVMKKLASANWLRIK